MAFDNLPFHRRHRHRAHCSTASAIDPPVARPSRSFTSGARKYETAKPRRFLADMMTRGRRRNRPRLPVRQIFFSTSGFDSGRLSSLFSSAKTSDCFHSRPLLVRLARAYNNDYCFRLRRVFFILSTPF